MCVGFINKVDRGCEVGPLSILYAMIRIRMMIISEKGICFSDWNNDRDGDILSAFVKSRTPCFWLIEGDLVVLKNSYHILNSSTL